METYCTNQASARLKLRSTAVTPPPMQFIKDCQQHSHVRVWKRVITVHSKYLRLTVLANCV